MVGLVAPWQGEGEPSPGYTMSHLITAVSMINISVLVQRELQLVVTSSLQSTCVVWGAGAPPPGLAGWRWHRLQA